MVRDKGEQYMEKVKMRYVCVICDALYNSEEGASKCYDSHFNKLVDCHFCNKKLKYSLDYNMIDGGSDLKVISSCYSRHKGKVIGTVICDDCWDKLFGMI